MISEAIKELVENKNLSYNEALTCMDEIFNGEATEIQTAS